MKAQPSLAIYGHVGFDLSIRSGNSWRTTGGAAYYASMAAAAQGIKVNVVTVLGSDFPIEDLNFRRLDSSTSFVSDGPSATFTQTYDHRNEVNHFEGRLNVCAELDPERIPLSTEGPSAILITTAPPLQQLRALQWLREQEYKGLIAIDTALPYVAEFNTLVQREELRIGLLFVNSAEFEALTVPLPSSTTTIVKRGSQGACILENGTSSIFPAPTAKEVKVVTGAGDVLAGTYLAAYLQGNSSAESLAVAVAFATSFVELGPDCFYQSSFGVED